MPVPDYQTLMLPVLKLFAEGKSSVPECIDDIKKKFSITDEEAEELIPSGRMSLLYNRVHWARTYLGKAGLLRSPKRGTHEITNLGIQFLEENPTELNAKTLTQLRLIPFLPVSTTCGVARTDALGVAFSFE